MRKKMIDEMIEEMIEEMIDGMKEKMIDGMIEGILERMIGEMMIEKDVIVLHVKMINQEEKIDRLGNKKPFQHFLPNSIRNHILS